MSAGRSLVHGRSPLSHPASTSVLVQPISLPVQVLGQTVYHIMRKDIVRHKYWATKLFGYAQAPKRGIKKLRCKGRQQVTPGSHRVGGLVALVSSLLL